MFMEHCAFPIIFVKGQKEQLNPYEKNYLIPQMALSVWQSILALLSIVSVAWPECIKPHLKSNFMSKGLERAMP